MKIRPQVNHLRRERTAGGLASCIVWHVHPLRAGMVRACATSIRPSANQHESTNTRHPPQPHFPHPTPFLPHKTGYAGPPRFPLPDFPPPHSPPPRFPHSPKQKLCKSSSIDKPARLALIRSSSTVEKWRRKNPPRGGSVESRCTGRISGVGERRVPLAVHLPVRLTYSRTLADKPPVEPGPTIFRIREVTASGPGALSRTRKKEVWSCRPWDQADPRSAHTRASRC